jgi:hypothetical protein
MVIGLSISGVSVLRRDWLPVQSQNCPVDQCLGELDEVYFLLDAVLIDPGTLFRTEALIRL